VSVGAERALGKHFSIEPGGLHWKMALTDRDRLTSAHAEGEVLTRDDLTDLTLLYGEAYPSNWFDPRMLETGQYVGVRRQGRLVAVAGIHVWSPVYRICALGNVTTHPSVRGQGLGKAVVAALCRRLLKTVDEITLNVKADNASAIAVYAALGFTRIGEYHEMWASAGAGTESGPGH
jgi:predicted GNAT family acetyltransferase